MKEYRQDQTICTCHTETHSLNHNESDNPLKTSGKPTGHQLESKNKTGQDCINLAGVEIQAVWQHRVRAQRFSF